MRWSLPLFTLVALLALPCATVLVQVVFGSDSVGFSALDGREWTLLARSLGVSALATAFALPMGIASAFIALSARPTAARWIEWSCYVPLLLPNIVMVLGWIHFAGVTGVLTELLDILHVDSGGWLYSVPGVAFVLSLCNFPCITLFCIRRLRQLDLASIRAAHIYGGPLQVVFLLTGAVAPSIVSGSSLVFLLSFADFGVPSALMVNVFPVEVFVQLTAFLNHDRALTILSVPIVVALLVTLLRPRLPLSGASGTETRLEGATPRSVSTLGYGTLALALGIPLLFLLITAGHPGNYTRSLRIAGQQLLNSQIVALWSVAVVMVIAILFVALHRRCRTWVRHSSESALLVLLVLPGGATGLGLLSLSGASHHPAVLALAVACRYLAFPVFLLLMALPARSDSRLRAARLAGAHDTSVLLRIVAPMMRPALVTATAVVAVLSLGELSAAVLVSPPGSMTLPVRLSSLLHFGEDSVVAALCVILTSFIVGVLALAQLLVGGRGATP